MKKYLKVDPWLIIEDNFNPDNHRSSESIFSIGNGQFGQRANFEEDYSGKTLQGTYVAGVYYPDKTKVGWWKNGYPEYFAKVLNSTNFTGIKVKIDGESLDLSKCEVLSFTRVLNMKEGTLSRDFVAEMSSGKQVQVSACRFLSMAKPETGVISYSIKPLNFDAEIEFTPYLDGNVVNQDANWDEVFWKQIKHEVDGNEAYLQTQTKKTEFDVANGMFVKSYLDNAEINITLENSSKEGFVSATYKQKISKNSELKILKYISVLSSLNHSRESILSDAKKVVREAAAEGYDKMLADHKQKWASIWEHSDIIIEGDAEAQQGIRFNIFHLNQTYTGEDERLNVGPKGFTGEKYGGASYWDTEAYCIPFFLATAPPRVSKNLLLYRYKQLDKAIENGQKLGFTDGAALFPMVTMNGEECHNEWEITFEEIHRNGAMSYAIYNYVLHTGDEGYLVDYGLEVLIALSRFWAQRVNFSEEKKKYVILGVTGPNEYENNVNNNWYTNKIAQWTLKYTLEAVIKVKKANQQKYSALIQRLKLDENKEYKFWNEIISNMYLPEREDGIFLQQDGYMDKEQLTVDKLDPKHRPINQKWSWDRILRSVFIKQADVLQGIYFFENEFSNETIEKNFDFYEARTVHESSLSPCVHVVLASKLQRMDKAYELYLRTSRLDIDDYNHEVHEGLHITSMAGTYMAIIEGFAGKRVSNGKLVLNPQIPEKWTSFTFKILFRGSQLRIEFKGGVTNIENESEVPATIILKGKEYRIGGNDKINIKI
ncbi:MAG: glycoside hydrolase family 65 protein [Bacteroidales bacterium]|nr:glycoside hydrolase family 65 protein [Bacteroidales bacterium]MBN2818017.1 glycoside hydrolase family 65 protein [Bacteroidales bacterium]